METLTGTARAETPANERLVYSEEVVAVGKRNILP